MSDTPRTDESEHECIDEPVMKLGSVNADFARQLERELNAANSIIRQQQLLDEENLSLRQRIKQLEGAIDRASNRFFDEGSDGKVAAEMLTILCGIADEEESGNKNR